MFAFARAVAQLFTSWSNKTPMHVVGGRSSPASNSRSWLAAT